MKTILITILLGIQFGSHKVTVVPQNDLCPDLPNLHYPLDDRLICVPSDLPSDVIYLNGFE